MQNYGVHNYGAEQRIPDSLAESRWVTSNPEEADFFYVPAFFYCLHSDYTSDDLPELGKISQEMQLLVRDGMQGGGSRGKLFS
jgi:hypothetical protein